MSFYNKHGASCCLKETNTDKSFTHTSFRPLLYTEECVVSHYHLFKGCRFLNVRIFSALCHWGESHGVVWTEQGLWRHHGQFWDTDSRCLSAKSGYPVRNFENMTSRSSIFASVEGCLSVQSHRTRQPFLQEAALEFCFLFFYTCGSRSTPGIFGIILYKFEGHNTFEDAPRNHNELKHKRRRRRSVQQ